MSTQKKFTVYLDITNDSITKVAEFDTLQEAKEYCDGETAGRDEVDDRDNDWESNANNFHYEVYEGELIDFVYDEDGEVDDEKTNFDKEPIYQTKQFYFDWV